MSNITIDELLNKKDLGNNARRVIIDIVSKSEHTELFKIISCSYESRPNIMPEVDDKYIILTLKETGKYKLFRDITFEIPKDFSYTKNSKELSTEIIFDYSR